MVWTRWTGKRAPPGGKPLSTAQGPAPQADPREGLTRPALRRTPVLHEAAGFTAVGQVKTRNEDAHLIDSELGLFIVCDGLGGRPGGQVASRRACVMLRERIAESAGVIAAYRDAPDTLRRQQAQVALRRAVSQVSDELYHAGQANPSLRGMATTLVALLIAGKNALIVHAGDSRAYLTRGMQAFLLTEDHSLVNRQLQRGLITPEDALHSSQANAVTKAMGLHEQMEPTLLNVELMPGDSFLLCSDGLSRYVTTEEIARAGMIFGPTMMAKRLVQLADDRSGRDNITAVAIRIDPKQQVEGLNAGQKIDALRKIPLFQNLTYKEAIRVLSIVGSRSYQAGERVFAQGEAGSEFFVAATGAFRAVLDGQELATLRAGSFFGEMALLAHQPRDFDVYATEPARVLVISREDMHRLLQGEPVLAGKFLWAFCRVLAERAFHMGKELARVRFEVDNQIDPRDMTAPFDLSHLAAEVERAARQRAVRDGVQHESPTLTPATQAAGDDDQD